MICELIEIAGGENDMVFKITATRREVQDIAEGIVPQVVKLVSDEIAKKILQDRGEEMLASVPVSAVVNQAVAEVVMRIAREVKGVSR